MKLSVLLPAALALALSFTAATPLRAQEAKPWEPARGQAGRDVIWIPTEPETVQRMLEIAKVTPKDIVVDLGAGDGRIVIAAARAGATARGVEYNPDMTEFARRQIEKAGVPPERARMIRGDLFEHDISDATVITLYLLPGLNLKLRPRLLELRPGTRIVSHAFTMGEWQEDAREEVKVSGGWQQTVYYWVVPARVGGLWNLAIPGWFSTTTLQVNFEQTFQMLGGTVRSGDRVSSVAKGSRLRGDEISFTLIDDAGVARQFTGRVSGDTMQGHGWSATRAGKK